MLSLNAEKAMTGKTTRFLKSLIQKGGPEQHEDQAFTDIVNQLKANEIDSFREIIKDSLNKNTLIGHGFVKPYGYPGDFSIIHSIYRFHMNPDPNYTNWDRFFQVQEGAHAVRNRKDFFLNCCESLKIATARMLKYLSWDAGPPQMLMNTCQNFPKAGSDLTLSILIRMQLILPDHRMTDSVITLNISGSMSFASSLLNGMI